jgi:hypothetical protein
MSFCSFKGKVQGFGQTTDKGGFRLIFSRPQAVVKVRNDEMDVQFIFQFVENVKEANRVRPSGDSDDDRVTFGDHPVTRDSVFDLLKGLNGIIHTVLKIPL